MPALITLADGTIPVAADFMFNFNALNQAIGTSTAITGYVTGDMVYALAANTLTRLPIVATPSLLGITGAAPTWSPAVAFAVYRSTDQVIQSGTNTKLQFDLEEFDNHSAYDNATNFRFTIPAGAAGQYAFGAAARLNAVIDTAIFRLQLFKNGTAVRTLTDLTGSTTYTPTIVGSTLVSAAVADYFEVFAFQNTGAPQTISSGAASTVFWGHRLPGA